MLELRYAGNTDVGRMRELNEDTYYVGQVWENKPQVLGIVFDGMGGESYGDVASATAREAIVKYIKEHPEETDYQELMLQAFVYGNEELRKEQHEHDRSNIYTVVTGMLVDPATQKGYYGHVGDTRLYMLANGELKQITKDHSDVGEMEWSGELTEEQAMKHYLRPEVRRALGGEKVDDRGFTEFKKPYLETGSLELPEKFSLLLASDGLFDMVFKKDSKAILEQNVPLEERVQGLIDAANNAGGKDNVTVVVVETK
jgi:protein serine/threonine phosphatase